MSKLPDFFDQYEIGARLRPGVVLFLPISLAIYVAAPEMFLTGKEIVSILITFGGAQFASSFIRDKGKKEEARLFETWGGKPSIAVMRLTDKTISLSSKLEYHQKLSGLTNTKAPDLEFENANPNLADEIYERWSDFLRSTTRDQKKYRLLFKENVTYGFRRNLLGLRTECLLMGFAGILLTAFVSLQDYLAVSQISLSNVLVAIIQLIYIFLIAKLVNDEWVYVPALEYAKRLIETLDSNP